MSKSALVIIANGSEEMEAVITIDILRRAQIKVTVAGLENGDTVECSRQVKIHPDVSLSDTLQQVYDVIILPGGLGGAKSFAASETVGKLLKTQESAGRLCAAICAAPIAFNSHAIGKGRNVTSYPGVKDQLQGYTYSEERVVVDGNIVTSRGPGTAVEFALKLVEILVGPEEKQKHVQAMLIK